MDYRFVIFTHKSVTGAELICNYKRNKENELLLGMVIQIFIHSAQKAEVCGSLCVETCSFTWRNPERWGYKVRICLKNKI